MHCKSKIDGADEQKKGETIVQCFKKWANPGLFFCLFSVFLNKQYNFYNKSMPKNVHLVYGDGIRTHNLQNISHHP